LCERRPEPGAADTLAARAKCEPHTRLQAGPAVARASSWEQFNYSPRTDAGAEQCDRASVLGEMQGRLATARSQCC